MSMRPDFQNRDFSKKPLKRSETQINFDPNNEEEKGFRAQQHHNQGRRLDSDKIVANYFKTGVITHTRDSTARYIDASVFSDFRENMNRKVYADQAYNQLPEQVRAEFEDPRAFVEFALDPANLDQLREWGLAEKIKETPVPKPQEVVIVNPEAPKAEEQAA